jgi:hypothetical protein
MNLAIDGNLATMHPCLAKKKDLMDGVFKEQICPKHANSLL